MSKNFIIFLLAHAGGPALGYQMAFKNLGKSYTLCALDLPGHGRRINEPLLDCLELIVDDIVYQAKSKLGPKTTKFAIFGHSMGGLLAYLLAETLIKEGYTPKYLFISSSCAPGGHKVPFGLLKLPEAQFWKQSLTSFDNPNHNLADNTELMAIYAPILRADLTAVINYIPNQKEPLSVPLVVFFADKDIISKTEMDNWQNFIKEPLKLYLLKGGHFHPLLNPMAIEQIIKSFLEKLDG